MHGIGKVGSAHAGKAAIVVAFLGLAAFVTAGAMFPTTSSSINSASGPPGSRSSTDRVTAPASDIAVIDGGTLRLANLVVRLLGVEAPSRACQASAGDCGAASTAALAALVRARQVTCELRDSDANGRPLAVCYAGEAAGGNGGKTELNRALVASGWARASPNAGRDARATDLKDAETEARAEGRGLWAETPAGSAKK